VVSEGRWGENWRAVSPVGAVRVSLHRSVARRHARQDEIRCLPAGTPVVLCASAPGALGRCRRFASGAGLELERQYLAFPSADAPAYLVEDAPAPVSLFVETVLAAPPRTRFSLPIGAGLGLLRRGPWRLFRAVAPGRVVVSRRL
jgi:hypothetical protein